MFKNSKILNFLISFKNNGIKYTIHRVIYYHLNPIIDNFILKFCLFLTKNKELKDIIVMESFSDFDCNSGAIYDYIIKNNINQKYKIVWILNYNTKKELPENVESYYSLVPGFKKNFRLCMAKYIIVDNNIIKKVRKNQILIYCTHGGICFKDVRNLMNFRDFNIDYVLSPAKNYESIVSNKYNLDTNFTKIINTGYPSQDIFFYDTINEYEKIFKDKYNKYIMWMPTFRKGHGNRNDSTEELPLGIPIFKSERELEKINNELKKYNNILIIKMHPGQLPKSYERLKNNSNILILTSSLEKKLNINKYNLMKYTDALISDYSGAAYEFLLLNKPLGFVVSDIDNYKIGFIVENIKDYMPGKLIYNKKDFFDFIFDINNNKDFYKIEREKMLNYYYDYKDEKNSERVLKYLKII